MEKSFELKWKRPESSDFPKVWHTFRAKDFDSDRLVEYRIEDLTESRSEEALKIMVQYFCNGEPVCDAFGIANDPVAEEDLVKYVWKPVIEQKMVLVCYKTGSDEIVGLNTNFVTYKDEHFYEKIQKQFKSEKNVRHFDTLFLIGENFNICEHYGVDKYLSSAGLVVPSKYRGRSIGEQFLNTRKFICRHFGIKLTSTLFTSYYSDKSADKVGFKLDTILSFDEIRKKHPKLRLPKVNSEAMTLRSIYFPDI